jgi:hypothetical protein
MSVSRVLCLIVAMTAQAMASGIIYVDSRADGADNGTTWADAYTNLQDALDVAHDGMEIWVAGGPYFPDRDSFGKPSGPHDTFTVRGPGVKVFGGFLGSETSRQERNAFQHQTVVAGEAEKYHVVTIDSYFGADENTAFDGFIVTGGLADGDSKGGDNYGGGMIVFDANVVIANCWFVANHAEYAGGALKISADNVKIANCQFTDNSAGTLGFEGLGGAIWSLGGTQLVNCLFHTNFAGIGGFGHAAWFSTDVEGDAASLDNCTFTNNGPIDPTGDGTIGIDGVLLVRNSIIWGNRTKDDRSIAYDEGDIVLVSFSDVEGGFDGEGNISVDPQFASSFVESFRLVKASPCTDVGDQRPLPPDFADLDQNGDRSEVVPLDLELTPRVFGPGLNLGCFETFDCQANNIGDYVEFASGASLDCNNNDIPDECDIRDCDGDPACGDCNKNGQLDLCESQEDCNDDGIADICQSDTKLDSDGDGIRDCLDNCPTKPNADQLDGDENGFGDACDSLLTLGPCPTSIQAGPETLEGATVTFQLPSAEHGYGIVTITATPASGTRFPIGKTTVQVRATDDGGGDVSCSFEVTVLEPDTDTGQDGDCPPLYRMNSGALRLFGLPGGCGPGCLITVPFMLAGLTGMKLRRRHTLPR